MTLQTSSSTTKRCDRCGREWPMNQQVCSCERVDPEAAGLREHLDEAQRQLDKANARVVELGQERDEAQSRAERAEALVEGAYKEGWEEARELYPGPQQQAWEKSNAAAALRGGIKP